MDERSLLVVYGSQTGTAQDVAESVVRCAQRRHFSVQCTALDDYPVGKLIKEQLAVFVVSTTGQGDPPDNMKKFWRFIMRKNLPPSSLSQLSFLSFGLGDSSYQKYNFIAKKLHKRLSQLGATPLHPLTLADDQHELGVEGAVGNWLITLCDKLLEFCPLPQGYQVIPDTVLLPSKFSVKLLEEKGDGNNINSWVDSRAKRAQLISNERVTASDHWQDVRLIKLRSAELKYNAGDVLMVQPENSDDVVNDFLSLFKLQADAVISIEPEHDNLGDYLSGKFTADWLARHYLDLCTRPRRYFWELLAHFTDSELEAEKLQEFLTAEGQEELFSYCHRPRRNILEVLADFPHAMTRIPIDYLFDLIPKMQPRAFSIASSNKVKPGDAQLLMAVVKYRTKLHKPRLGVCSTWLASLKTTSAEAVSVWVQPGTITFPEDLSIPVIMVGPGTGVAPFRAFIQERIAVMPENSHNITDGGIKMMLFFGCRNKDKDYFCEEEWSGLENKGLIKVVTAFSRDQEDKVYVQHRIKEHGPLLWELIHHHNAYFFVAGNAKRMPDDVREALLEVIKAQGNLSEDEAQSYLNQMDRTKRYQAETWS